MILGDRHDVADEIERKLLVERRVDRVGRADDEQRVTVRWCPHDGFGADVAAGPRPVVDDELLAQPFREPLRDEARGDVGRTAGGKADDDAHRPRRIGLRPCEARNGWRCDGACCKTEKSTAGIAYQVFRVLHGFCTEHC